MRKSFAPSFQSNKARVEGKQCGETVFKSSSRENGAASKSVRSAANILNLLNESSDSKSFDDIPCQLHPSENISSNFGHRVSTIIPSKKSLNTPKDFEGGENYQPLPDNVESKKRKFNVVWGKLSKKKHKKWEGDGVAEIGLHTVVLKDCDGKVLGSTRGVKTDELEEGSRLIVGGKEIELIDLIPYDTKGDETEGRDGRLSKPEIPTAPPAKKHKFMLSKTCGGTNTPSQDSLVMPIPPSEHQQTSIAEPTDDDDAVIDELLNI